MVHLQGFLLHEVEPLKLPVPEINCLEPPEDEDSLGSRNFPGIGTANGKVQFGSGDLEPWLNKSLFGDGYIYIYTYMNTFTGNSLLFIDF